MPDVRTATPADAKAQEPEQKDLDAILNDIGEGDSSSQPAAVTTPAATDADRRIADLEAENAAREARTGVKDAIDFLMNDEEIKESGVSRLIADGYFHTHATNERFLRLWQKRAADPATYQSALAAVKRGFVAEVKGIGGGTTPRQRLSAEAAARRKPATPKSESPKFSNMTDAEFFAGGGRMKLLKAEIAERKSQE
jgi:hypothetical protein